MVAEGCPVAPTVTGSGCSAWSAQQGWGLGSLAQNCVGLTLVWGHQVSERGTTASLAPGGEDGAIYLGGTSFIRISRDTSVSI